jgi:glucose/arabinose dehydrogenase
MTPQARSTSPEMLSETRMAPATRAKTSTGLGVALAIGLVAACGGTAKSQETIRLEPVVDGLVRPVFLTHAGDGSGRLFVLEQEGLILVLGTGGLEEEPLLDLSEKVLCCGERGLLGLAFHPSFPDDPRLFVNYTRRPDGATVVSEFRLGQNGQPNPGSERVLLTIAQPFSNHNGGMIAFGLGDRLFIGMGDGGSGGDPQNHAQNPNSLLGKMLRIGVNGRQPYAIPANNPYAAGGGRPEIYAIGLRNPWRFSIDRATGQLYVGDVGQNAIEEIDIVVRGGNYGWRHFEGTRPYRPAGGIDRNTLKMPITEYGHDDGRCSVTGGYIYRGQAIPELAGTYLYADYCTGEIFGLADGGQRVLLDTSMLIPSFGEDEAGEVYVVDHGGAIHRIAGVAP